jgi:AIR carboxylase
LPGMVASMTALPVIGVPVRGSSLDGVDSLYSIVQMPVSTSLPRLFRVNFDMLGLHPYLTFAECSVADEILSVESLLLQWP